MPCMTPIKSALSSLWLFVDKACDGRQQHDRTDQQADGHPTGVADGQLRGHRAGDTDYGQDGEGNGPQSSQQSIRASLTAGVGTVGLQAFAAAAVEILPAFRALAGDREAGQVVVTFSASGI